MANNPKVKFDLSQTVREVGELNRALESLGGIAQNLFNNLGRLTDSFNSSLSNMQNTASNMSSASDAGPSSYMTSTGQQHASQALEREIAQAELFRKTREAVESGAAIQSGGMYRTKIGSSPSGNQFQNLMSVEEFERQKRFQELRNQAQQNDLAAASQNRPFVGPPRPNYVSSSMPAFAPARSLDAMGMSMADVAKTFKGEVSGESAKGLSQVSDTIRQLNQQSANQNSENARMMRETARILESLRDEMKASKEEFHKAAQSFSEVANLPASDPRRQAAQERLLSETGRQQRLEEQLMSATQEGGGMLGGGGQPPGFLGRLRGLASKGGGLIGSGLSAYNAYLGIEQAIDQATYGTRLSAEQHKANIAQTTFEMQLGSMDMTKAENVMKYRADVLFPDKNFKFIGQKGLGNAANEAAAMEAQRVEMEARAGKMSLSTGAMKIGGAAALGSAIGPWGALGAGLIAAGGVVSDLIKNPIVARSGLLGGTAQENQLMLSEMNRRNITQSLMDAEMRQNAPIVRAMQDILDIENAEEYAAPLVGGAILSSQSQVRAEYRKGGEKIARAKSLLKSQARLNAKTQFDEQGIPGSMLNLDITPYTSNEVAAAERAIAGAPDTVFTRLQMSPAELVQRKAELMNAMNLNDASLSGPNGVEGAVRLGRAGLGNFSQILGNLSQLSGVAGGTKENSDRLRDVLSSAVASGFDTSRMAQNFVQSTLRIADSVRGRNVSDMAQRLGGMAALTGLNVGTADELSLRTSAAGIQSYNEFTRSTSGAIGAFKGLALIGAGAGPGANLFNMTGMGAVEYDNALSQLEGGSITDPKIKQMLEVEKGNLRRQGISGPEQESQARANLLSKLRSGSASMRRFTTQAFSNVSGLNIESELNQLKSLSKKDKATRVQELLGTARGTGNVIGLGEEGGMAAMSELITAADPSLRQDVAKAKQDLSTQIKRGNYAYQNPGKRNLRRFLDDLIREQGAFGGQMGEGDIERYFESGGAPIRTESGDLIDSSNYKQNISKLQGMTRLDLARAASNAIALDEGTQRVHVVNFDMLASELKALPTPGVTTPNMQGNQGN